MRRLCVALVALTCAACEDAVVISADGNTELGYCIAGGPTCVQTFCSEGSVALHNSGRNNDGDTVVRCLGRDGGAP